MPVLNYGARLHQRIVGSERLRSKRYARFGRHAAAARREAKSAREAYKRGPGVRDVNEVFETELRDRVSHKSTSGRRRLDDFFAALQIINDSVFSLSEKQMEIIHCYLIAGLQQMFGDELLSELAYLLERFQLTELYEEVIVMMKRRGGKTVVTSVFIAIWLATQPVGNAMIFSNGARVSQLMKDHVRECVVAISRSQRFDGVKIGKPDNKEILTVITAYDSKNTGSFMPASVDIRPLPSPVVSCHFAFCVYVLVWTDHSRDGCGLAWILLGRRSLAWHDPKTHHSLQARTPSLIAFVCVCVSVLTFPVRDGRPVDAESWG